MISLHIFHVKGWDSFSSNSECNPSLEILFLTPNTMRLEVVCKDNIPAILVSCDLSRFNPSK